jgi:hypothetical protein
MAATAHAIVSEFDDSMGELNAQYWLLLALTANSAAVARAASPLDGFPYERSLQVLVPNGRRYLNGIRLRNHRMSADLAELSARGEAWLPSYFLILGKSLAEGTALALIDLVRATTPAVCFAFHPYRRRHDRMPVTRALESLASAAARGAFDTVYEVIPIARHGAALRALTPDLSRFNQTRNRLAHRLGEQLTSGTGVTHEVLLGYLRKLDRMIKLLRDLP